MIIGVTDCSKYVNYASWILAQGPEVKVKKLTWQPSGMEAIKDCDGVVLTGGEDVHPRFYNRPDLYAYCYKDDVSEVRDEFELKILEPKPMRFRCWAFAGDCRSLMFFLAVRLFLIFPAGANSTTPSCLMIQTVIIPYRLIRHRGCISSRVMR